MENIDLAVLAQLVTAVVAAGFALVKSIAALVAAVKRRKA